MSWRSLTLLFLVLATPAQADLMWQGVRLDLEAGAFCLIPPDGLQAAPQTLAGSIDTYDRPYPLYLKDDQVSAFADIGIGVIVRLYEFVPNEPITVKVQVPDRALPDVWTISVGNDGMFWFGQSPAATEHLRFGTYRFTALRGDKELLRYDIRVREPSVAEAAQSPCSVAVVS